MYIQSLSLRDFRTFGKARLEFLHADRPATDELPSGRLPNVNVLLGDNGSGKTSVLRAIALAGLGPIVGDTGLLPHSLVRRTRRTQRELARIEASFTLHARQDESPLEMVKSVVAVQRRDEIEQLRWAGDQDTDWKPVYKSSNVAFFMVGYGATRRVERPDSFNLGARSKSRLPRAQRVQGLFEDSYSLIPLGSWLPAFESRNRGRHKQVVTLLNRILKPTEYRFTGEFDQVDYLFERKGVKVPFQAMSDGYRALIGWVADLLYHVCFNCPDGLKLVDARGVALVDEVDLHLHPGWQMKVIDSLAAALPRMQFIFTTHSPLIVGSLEWMNVLVMREGPKGVTAERVRRAIHGLDADQLLVTDLFGLASTRPPPRPASSRY